MCEIESKIESNCCYCNDVSNVIFYKRECIEPTISNRDKILTIVLFFPFLHDKTCGCIMPSDQASLQSW